MIAEELKDALLEGPPVIDELYRSLINAVQGPWLVAAADTPGGADFASGFIGGIVAALVHLVRTGRLALEDVV